MTPNEYQALAGRTLDNPDTPDTSPDQRLRLAIFGLGISGEAGEVSDLIKKFIGHGHELDRSKLVIELGDVLWYLVAIATLRDISLSEVMAANIAKLEARFPDGFTHEASRNRVEGTH